jgi:hypothetical protein
MAIMIAKIGLPDGWMVLVLRVRRRTQVRVRGAIYHEPLANSHSLYFS